MGADADVIQLPVLRPPACRAPGAAGCPRCTRAPRSPRWRAFHRTAREMITRSFRLPSPAGPRSRPWRSPPADPGHAAPAAPWLRGACAEA